MEKLARMALLADFYGPLLTEKQRNVWDLHYQQDLSLAEIAEVEQISRQAVHDLLKRTERILNEYEEKLGLVQRFWNERSKVGELKTLMEEIRREDFVSEAAYRKYQDLKQKAQAIFAEIVD